MLRLGFILHIVLLKTPKPNAGYDIDNTIFNYALSNFRATNYKISLSNEDYLVSSWTQKYDAVICNPPYLKFHDYDNATLIPLVNKNFR